MKFGLILPQGWLNDIKSVQEINEIARHAESLGFNSLYVYDHLLPYNKYSNIQEPILECWTLLSSLINLTSKIRLGIVVLCNSYRNPALLAKMAGTFEYLSNYRLEFGIGAGWYKEEYDRFGYQFPNAKNRLEQLDEALYIIKELLKNGKVQFDGKHYKVNAICNPCSKNIKIMVGGISNTLLKIASKHADIYNYPFGKPEEVKEKVMILRNYSNSLGRKDIEISVLLRAIFDTATFKKFKNVDESIDEYIARIKDSVLMRDNARELLNRYREVGVTHFIIHMHELNLDNMYKLRDIISSL